MGEVIVEKINISRLSGRVLQGNVKMFFIFVSPVAGFLVINNHERWSEELYCLAIAKVHKDCRFFIKSLSILKTNLCP